MPSILSNLKNAREWAMPTLKSSAFLERGVLTPDEFVRAGDELVYKCPTWTWESGDPSKRKKHLPADKQYLITRNVPCTARVSSLENVVAVSKNFEDDDDDDDGDWLVSQILTAEEQKKREDAALEEEFDILNEDGEVVSNSDLEKTVGEMSLGRDDEAKISSSSKSNPIKPSEKEATVEDSRVEEDDEYADMADFEDEDVMADEAAAILPPASDLLNNVSNMSNDETNQHILRVRTYDLSITYDKYYQTPRVWLMGYTDDGAGNPLTGDQMMQDVISDYAHRTVTIENHPHVSGPHASIHPCQHGAVMKTIVRNLTGEGKKDGSVSAGPSVEMYLFIFLKFVSSMIPTINYDFTMDVSASTKK